MAKWERTCREFTKVRELIKEVDTVGIMEALLKICRKYSADEDYDFAFDFDCLADDIEMELEDKENIMEDKDIVDYYLSEFYDLCDAARIWLAV